VAPAVAAGALSAYIVRKGVELYELYREWRNLRSGVAILNPVEIFEDLGYKRVRNGETGWSQIVVYVSPAGSGKWSYGLIYREHYNENGKICQCWYRAQQGVSLSDMIIREMNQWLKVYMREWRDLEGRALFVSLLETAYDCLIMGSSFSYSASRELVPALETENVEKPIQVVGYIVDVDPESISEEDVNYLDDPATFYDWFISNYMSGTNQGVYVTPLDEAYDEIRSDLQVIIDKLNELSVVGGGVSEEVLNEVKREIINSVNSSVNSVKNEITSLSNSLQNDILDVKTSVDALTNEVNELNSSVNSVKNEITSLSNSLQNDILDVKTSVDALTNEVNELNESQEGFWDGLMSWLDEGLWGKLKDFWKEFLTGEWFKDWVIGLARWLFVVEEDQLNELVKIEVPEYKKKFDVEVSFSSYSANIPIKLFGTTVDLSRYIGEYAAILKQFMNIFVSGLAAVFVIRAFRVHFNID